jgi:hypothetical protein
MVDNLKGLLGKRYAGYYRHIAPISVYKNSNFSHINQTKIDFFENRGLCLAPYSQLASAKLASCRKKTFFGQSKFSFLRGLRLILY